MTDPVVAITLDVDWAPDACIDDVASTLLDAGVRATWFITHWSPAIARLQAHPEQFELGWHPNFFAGSTHGASEAEVLAHCATWLPNARAVRTHGLLQSTRLLDLMRRTTPLRVDVSLLLRHQPHLAPHRLPLPSGEIIRLPFWWEDDVEMVAKTPLWALATAFRDGVPGWRVLNFHPIHVALDAASMHPYEALKRRVPSLQEATADDLRDARGEAGEAGNPRQGGAGQAFREAVMWLRERGGGATVSQLVAPLLD
ncbi:hypothetical protein [Gemmatimonas phototrophica]|uniref:polysaccharide deacetylase WbmS family protein n=1 Tax=Gemmatimonas phototrophica TaxID=1379270 RepID=UPI00047C7970|nr:hypothetical protein [Gemmatimonas phototrophica]